MTCNSYVLPNSLIEPTLYIDSSLLPSIDRPKPQRPSTVYTTDGGCDPQFAQWECPVYAYDQCEHLYNPASFSEQYLQCLDDRFTACRRGAGCNYTFALEAADCDPTQQRPLSQLIREGCQRPDQEFSSAAAYQACVDRVTRFANDGCSNISPGRWGVPQNLDASARANAYLQN